MKLAFADPRNLTISPHNMHHGRPAPDVSDIQPSIRQRGVLLTMLVLEKIEDGAVVPDHFEIVAGARRWHAVMAVIGEGVDVDPVPIAILEAGDDAAAIEASLLENIARLPPDEVSCWETFVKLIKKGRSPEQIAVTFDKTDVAVRRILALGNLLPRIRTLYRKEAVEVATVRALTLASKTQQKEWLALFDDPQARAPTGHQLKAWLFGGTSIPTKNALFSLDDYPGQIIADLFGDDSYFTDPNLFWTHQNQAVAAKREAMIADGWVDVEILETGKAFETWKHERTSKKNGGKTFIAVNARGEVTIHEGFLTPREAKRAAAQQQAGAKGEGAAAASSDRPEVTSAQQAYIDLHRHSAVRAVLVDHPAVALRLLVAHALAGSAYWKVEPDPRRSGNEAVQQSLEGSPAEYVFRERRRMVAERLGVDGEHAITGKRWGTAEVFAKLLALSDAEVLAVAAVVMGETLAAGSEAAEAAGLYLKVDMGEFWSPDSAFFDLIRDRETVNAMLKDVGGKKVADGNVGEKVKTQKAILRDFLDGTNDRPKVERWTPKWLSFPAGAYTKRRFKTAERDKALAPLLRRATTAAADTLAAE